MSNEDREAFEKWARNEGSYELSTDRDGDYQRPDTWELHRGWQAARDHYAPKLTEKEAIEVAAKAIQERYWIGDLPISIQDAKTVCIEFATAVLRASGIKFREES